MARPKRNDLTVKVDAEVIRVCKIVAAYEEKTLAEWLSDTLRPLALKALERHQRRGVGRPEERGGAE
jgi:hypothetical protein